tara:strand:- start:2943 stop:3551 length:609 start_codon:yes stop_codon:yes gene_type:complete
MATTKKNYYTELSQIDISGKIEKKGKFDYLSWASAWDMLKKMHPDANRIIYEHEHSGLPIFPLNNSAQVKVGVIVNGIEHIDMLPIIDFRNNEIPLEKIGTMDINTAIQRSTAKAIAMHGLGLSLWIGEDVKAVAEEKKPQAVVNKSKTLTLDIGDANWTKVLSYVSDNKKLGLDKIVTQLERKYKITAKVKKEIQTAVNSK